MPALETFTKRAAIASLLTITAVQLALHPDTTWVLRTAGIAAVAIGWISAGDGAQVRPVWLVAAVLAPALLRFATGREGPVLDMVWMAGLSAALIRSVSWSAWALPHTWRVFAGGWALTVALAWPILVARETGFDLTLLRDHGAINSSGMLSAPQSGAWILYIAWMHLLGLLWLDWVSARFAAAREQVPNAVHGLWIGVTLSGLVALYQAVVDLDFLNTGFWASNARATGTALDANAYGIGAAIAGPIAFAVLRARGATLAAASVLLVNVAGVWISGSRTAALCAGIGIAALLIGLWRTLAAAARRRLAISVAAGAAGLAAVLLGARTIGPAQRLAELPDTPTGAVDAALNRGPYGSTAMQMIRDYPASGVGIGAYQIIAPDYWRRQADDMLPFDTAQNWWRHQAAELGLIGGLTLFVWSAAIGWTVISTRASPRQGITMPVVRGVLLALGVCSVIQMPTQTPIVLLWFLFLVAWLAIGLRESPPAGLPDRVLPFAWSAAAALALAYAATHAALATGPLEVAERARWMHREYFVGTYPPEQLPDSTTFRWTRQEARLRLPSRGRWLVVRLWAHHPDVGENPVAVRLAAPCGMVFSTQLESTAAVRIGIVLPPDQETFDALVQVSRTWRPADHGEEDTRHLGVGISTDFVDDRELLSSQDHVTEWRECP